LPQAQPKTTKHVTTLTETEVRASGRVRVHVRVCMSLLLLVPLDSFTSPLWNRSDARLVLSFDPNCPNEPVLNQILNLCRRSREIFLQQPVLLELMAPIKIVGGNIL
jgi:hypothetical protein